MPHLRPSTVSLYFSLKLLQLVMASVVAFVYIGDKKTKFPAELYGDKNTNFITCRVHHGGSSHTVQVGVTFMDPTPTSNGFVSRT